MTEFLMGVYFTTFMFFFVVMMGFCILGGRQSDLWKPFVYATFWPIVVILMSNEAVKKWKKRQYL